MREIDSSDWNRCAGDSNPFVSHQFLSALEESGCVGPGTGWGPFPAQLRDSSGRLIACAPSYLKSHSQGEYIFDYHWADAYHRLQPSLHYYPKLQVAVPFTPVPGPRLLLDKDLAEPGDKELLLQGFQRLTRESELSSAHITFCQERESETAEKSGYLSRLGEQYHWFNDDYQDFEHFLSTLTSRKRKTIRKEREKAVAQPITIHTFHGDDITPTQLKMFFRMYENTCLRKWGRPYLNLDFFQLLSQKLGRRLVIFMVRQEETQRWVAGAWNLRGRETLYGRNWGCLEHLPFLHFEVCYYRAIDYAIENGLKKVEAGAQGMHKIQRGYRPRPVFSSHHFESVEFGLAIAQYLESERHETEYRLEALTSLEPFKQGT